MLIGGKGDQIAQVQIQLALNQNAQHTQGGAAQGEGVLGAGGLLADGENTHQGIDTIGQGEDLAHLPGRQTVTGLARHVLLIQGIGHGLGIALGEGVVAAHDALQFGELVDHLGDQVTLGHGGGAGHLVAVGTDLLGDAVGQGGHAYGLLLQGAQLFLEHHGGQPLTVLLQGLFAVLIPEKLGIGQARANHPLVTGAHLIRIPAFDIGQGDKVGQQFAVLVEAVEILLMPLHGGDERLSRNAQEALLEAAGEGHRPLHQGGHLIQQVGIDHRLAAEALGGLQHLGAHALTPRFKIDHHPGGLQLVGITGGGVDLDGLRGVKTMTAGAAAAFHIENLGLYHLIAEQQHQPVDRAHELTLQIAPAHALRDGQLIQ